MHKLFVRTAACVLQSFLFFFPQTTTGGLTGDINSSYELSDPGCNVLNTDIGLSHPTSERLAQMVDFPRKSSL